MTKLGTATTELLSDTKPCCEREKISVKKCNAAEEKLGTVLK